jgi:predicted small lipoprotein YifL
MRKSLSLILAVAVVALVLSGCGGSGPQGIRVGDTRAEVAAKATNFKPVGGTPDRPVYHDTLVEIGHVSPNGRETPAWRMVTDRHTLQFTDGVLVGWTTEWNVQ